MPKRIDRYIEDALMDFGDWFVSTEWCGKERDCVNLFAHGFLSRGIQPGAAIDQLIQIRIESTVPPPAGYTNKTATKDLVNWKYGFTTEWVQEWKVSMGQSAVLEFMDFRDVTSDFDTTVQGRHP